jgi:hypothetical protein
MIFPGSLTFLVLGNGAPLSLPAKPVDICITFNGRKPPSAVKWHLDIASSRSAGTAGSKIEVNGEGPDDFVDRLRGASHHTARIYEAALGCWPSTGFTILHALWELDIAVQVRSIYFEPSLRRDGYLETRAVPPAMYHNWLGERRHTFARWLTAPPAAWDWPLMQPSMKPLQDSSHALPSLDLLTALAPACLIKRQMPRLRRLST